MNNPTTDRLRWQISPILALVLDDTENVDVEVLGHRAPVPNIKDLAEAVRQAHACQHGTEHPADTAILAAEIAKRAAKARTEMVGQHIAEAADYELRNTTKVAAKAIAGDIAIRAMTSMASLFTEAVVDVSGQILTALADHPDWQKTLGIRAMNDIGNQVLADMSTRAAVLIEFARQIAEMSDAEPSSEASETLAGLIADARHLLGIPEDLAAERDVPPISPNGFGPAGDSTDEPDADQ